MASYFEQYLNRSRPNRAQRRAKEQQRRRDARRATRQHERKMKGDDDGTR